MCGTFTKQSRIKIHGIRDIGKFYEERIVAWCDVVVGFFSKFFLLEREEPSVIMPHMLCTVMFCTERATASVHLFIAVMCAFIFRGLGINTLFADGNNDNG